MTLVRAWGVGLGTCFWPTSNSFKGTAVTIFSNQHLPLPTLVSDKVTAQYNVMHRQLSNTYTHWLLHIIGASVNSAGMVECLLCIIVFLCIQQSCLHWPVVLELNIYQVSGHGKSHSLHRSLVLHNVAVWFCIRTFGYLVVPNIYFVVLFAHIFNLLFHCTVFPCSLPVETLRHFDVSLALMLLFTCISLTC